MQQSLAKLMFLFSFGILIRKMLQQSLVRQIRTILALSK